MPAVFGHRWDRVIGLYPYLALGDLLMAVLLVPQAVLFARGLSAPIVVKQLFNLALLALVALLAVPTFGLEGFGLAYVASAVALLIVHFAARRVLFYRIGGVLPWLDAFGPPLFFPAVRAPERLVLLVPLALVGVLPASSRQLAGYAAEAWIAAAHRPGLRGARGGG